jgi:V-type H+-transporting ATPase subunit d
MITFNLDDGFAEAIVRGYKSGILSQADYSNLGQCDSLEGE